MNGNDAAMDLVERWSEVAARTSERLVPPPLRVVVDRTLVDMACAAGGGRVPVAGDLSVDVPAIDEWRRTGVPTEFRGRLTAIAVRPGGRRGRAA